MKKIMLPVLAIVALFLMIAWMAGLFVNKIEPGTAAIERAPTDNAIAAEAAEVSIIEKVPASVEAAQATLISSRLLAARPARFMTIQALFSFETISYEVLA